MRCTFPASALIFDQNGLRVATVGTDDKVLFKTVTIARDLGRDIELGSGLAPDDRIIVARRTASPTATRFTSSAAAERRRRKPEKVSEKQDVKG